MGKYHLIQTGDRINQIPLEVKSVWLFGRNRVENGMMFHAKDIILIFARNHVSLQFNYLSYSQLIIHEDILNKMMNV